MDVGMIGLGKMGAKMTARLLGGGHRVVVYDRDPKAARAAEGSGAQAVESLEQLVQKLSPPRACWVMLPAGEPTEETILALSRLLSAGDVVVDGGNANYADSLRRSALLRELGLHFVDVGTSGGVRGLEHGYCLMVGGEPEIVSRLTPLLETLAPGHNEGWGRVGPPGAGHFVKMVHNGIEYALMQAYAEGFALLRRKREFGLDLAQVAEIWRSGSVIRSWLLDLIAETLKDNPELEGIAPYVDDTGEGRWTVSEAIQQDLAAPAVTLALLQRLRSREQDFFSDKLLAALRHQFGGHEIKKA